MAAKLHPIQLAASRAGLSPDLLRAWEKRYRAVSPARTPGGQRVYSDEDIQRLRLLRLATAAGRRIGSVASLTTRELAALVAKDQEQLETPGLAVASTPSAEASTQVLAEVVREALQAGLVLDDTRLHQILQRQLLLLRPEDLITGVIAPLMRQVGELWHEEKLDPAQEHLISGVVREVLARLIATSQVNASALRLVVATPSGQRHEIGAMMAAAMAVLCRWRVSYLGADLPVEDLARAVVKRNAQALALSVVHPVADSALHEELRKLKGLLPPRVAVLVGGAAAESYREVLEQIGADILRGLFELKHRLNEIEKELS